MICTEQERAALMAAVEQYGIYKMQFALSPDGSAAEQLADDRADHYFAAILAEIERTHMIVPVKYSKCDSETTIYRLLLEESLLTNVSLLERAIEGRISEVLHGDSIRLDAAASDAQE